jgi:hypothetical protein
MPPDLKKELGSKGTVQVHRGTDGAPEKLMVLTVPDVAIIDGPGYRMSYGETTKRAPEGSVLSHERSH